MELTVIILQQDGILHLIKLKLLQTEILLLIQLLLKLHIATQMMELTVIKIMDSNVILLLIMVALHLIKLTLKKFLIAYLMTI